MTMCNVITVRVDAALDIRADLCDPEWVAPWIHGPAERLRARRFQLRALAMCVVRRQYLMRPSHDRFLPAAVLAVITVMTFAAIAGSRRRGCR